MDSLSLSDLMRLGDKHFESMNDEGWLSAILIYDEIIGILLKDLIFISNLYIKAKIWPDRLNLEFDEKLRLDQLIQAHKRTIGFRSKTVLLKNCERFSELKIKYINSFLRTRSDHSNLIQPKKLKNIFEEIYILYEDSIDKIERDLYHLQGNDDWLSHLGDK